MYKELSVCRAIMRLYSFCDFDENTHRIKISGAHKILSSYFKLEPVLKTALDSVGIEMYPSGVYSCFNGETRIVLEVAFIHAGCSITVPDELMQCLASLLSSLGRDPLLIKKQTLQWAYSGRFADRSFTQKFITDGLQMSNNRILIDFLTYAVANHDSLHHRVIHELLHTLGVTEEEMSIYTIPACTATYEIAKPFVEMLSKQVQTIEEIFVKSMQDFRNNYPNLEKQLLQMGDELSRYGFPGKIDTPIYTTSFLPAKFFPEPDVSGYEVLFM